MQKNKEKIIYNIKNDFKMKMLYFNKFLQYFSNNFWPSQLGLQNKRTAISEEV